MKKKIFNRIAMMALVTFMLNSCGMSSENTERGTDYEEYGDYDDSEEVETIVFRSSYDVYNYLNGKTFSGDGLRIRFYNNGRFVEVNGTDLSNNVQIEDIGVNENGIAYATVKMPDRTGGSVSTFVLLAVKTHAQLVDANDGTVYEY